MRFNPELNLMRKAERSWTGAGGPRRLIPKPLEGDNLMAHPLDGCRAKILRAEESIRSLDEELTVFLSRDVPEIKVVGQHQRDGLEYAFIAFGDSEVPLRFSVLAGEIVHHMRSSLDHLVYALIVRNGGTPSRNNQFPICATANKFEDARNSGLISGVSQSAIKLIEAVQPYTSPTPDDTVLSVVNQYDILDKHKLLVVVTAAVALGDTITIGVDAKIAATPSRQGKVPNIVGFGDPVLRKLTKGGVEVFTIRLSESAPELVANANVVPQIAFDECGRVKLAPVIQTLAGLLAGTRHTIESFAGEF